ncbi:MAG: class I SAM-dependent methyltransferase [Candidatus Acidiferrales bacterium]
MEQAYRGQQTANECWEKFAREDPYAYIFTSLKSGNPRGFWESGQRTVEEQLIPLAKARGICPGIGLELGCGMGRLVFPLAGYFLEVVGVDIAEGMVQRAQYFARQKGIRNVRFSTISGPEDLLSRAGNYSGRINFLYSLLVFQHIPESPMIEGYLQAIGALLEEDGIAYLQFDTRPKSIGYRVKSKLPDFLLPRFWRKGIRNIRRPCEEIEAGMRSAGLEIIRELTPATAYHRYILRKAPRSSFSS